MSYCIASRRAGQCGGAKAPYAHAGQSSATGRKAVDRRPGFQEDQSAKIDLPGHSADVLPSPAEGGFVSRL